MKDNKKLNSKENLEQSVATKDPHHHLECFLLSTTKAHGLNRGLLLYNCS